LAAVVTLPDPCVAEALAGSAVDFLIVDMEHAPISERELEGILIAASSCRKPTLVRVAANEAGAIQRVLDTGPEGVIVPRVATPEEAAAAVAAARFPPDGLRGYGPRRANSYGRDPSFARRNNEEVLVVLQIEDAAALAALETIVGVSGVGGVLIGPNHLAASMGLLGQVEHPRILEAVEKIIAACRDADLPVGCGTYAGRGAARVVAMGADFVVAGGDIWLLVQQVDENAAELQALVPRRA
jgi:4-hydroxy-2-oxoheptanedioate aldolase